MPNPLIDVVTVFHNQDTLCQSLDLKRSIASYEGLQRVKQIRVDNRRINRGYAKGCNLGARQGTAPVIGFLNPDCTVVGQFVDAVVETLVDDVVITGCRFGAPINEVKRWGCEEWVCGAAMFVKRSWFEEVGMFDEQFHMYCEEADLIRTAQFRNFEVKPIELPLKYPPCPKPSAEEAAEKMELFNQSAALFRKKWPL